jgi:hypothetical protein
MPTLISSQRPSLTEERAAFISPPTLDAKTRISIKIWVYFSILSIFTIITVSLYNAYEIKS